MTLARSFILSFILLNCIPVAHAQWVTMNGPSGKEIVGLTTADNFIVDTNIFVGDDDGVFLWSSYDSMWNPAGLSGIGIQSLITNGNDLIAGTGSGVCVSTDNGNDWAFDTGGMSGQYVFSFAFSDTNIVAGTDNGVFISNSSGVSWEASNFTDNYVFALAQAGPNLVAGSEGIYLSTDNGLTWNAENNALSNFDVLSLAVSGPDLFAGTADTGVFLSTDNGQTWNAVNNGLMDSNIYAIECIGKQTFVGTDSGVFLSTNNGANWLEVNNSFTEYYTGVYAFCTDGTFLYAGTGVGGGGVWRRLLNEFNGVTDAVEASPVKNVNGTSCSVYPNPFSQSTTINVTSPESGDARITIINILGAEVAQLFSGEISAGDHSFTWNAGEMPAGMYECIIQMNGQIQQVPIILER